jgi:phosphatidate cytidylyltransferase
VTAFQKRFISAIVMIAIMTGLFAIGKTALLPFTIIVMLGIQFEAHRLLFPNIKQYILILHLLITGGLTLCGPMIGFSNSVILAVLLGFVLDLFILPFAIPNFNQDIQVTLQSSAKYVTFVVYTLLVPSFTFLILSQEEHGTFWFLFLLFTTLGSDTAAYFVGKAFGKTKLSVISPSKTLEGSVGGALGASLIAIPFSFSSEIDTSLFTLIFIALVSGVLGQVGDLFESLLKRSASVKDSGTLIPGHGGLLDRVDGIIFASPWIYLVSSWLS